MLDFQAKDGRLIQDGVNPPKRSSVTDGRVVAPNILGRNSANNKVFVRSVMNFVIGVEWVCSIFKLKMGDSSEMVCTLQKALD